MGGWVDGGEHCRRRYRVNTNHTTVVARRSVCTGCCDYSSTGYCASCIAFTLTKRLPQAARHSSTRVKNLPLLRSTWREIAVLHFDLKPFVCENFAITRLNSSFVVCHTQPSTQCRFWCSNTRTAGTLRSVLSLLTRCSKSHLHRRPFDRPRHRIREIGSVSQLSTSADA